MCVSFKFYVLDSKWGILGLCLISNTDKKQFHVVPMFEVERTGPSWPRSGQNSNEGDTRVELASAMGERDKLFHCISCWYFTFCSVCY